MHACQWDALTEDQKQEQILGLRMKLGSAFFAFFATSGIVFERTLSDNVS